MLTKKRIKKTKKTKKINKKNIGFVLFYLKTLKILKILFNVSIFIFTIYIIYIFFTNDVMTKLKNNLGLEYSKLLHKNICADIKISGIERANIDVIKEKINKFCELKNKNNINILMNEINEDPWIKNLRIKRKLPNTLQIEIEEYLPFALLKYDNDKLHLIDENGTIIKINEDEKREYFNLLIVAGDGSKENIYTLFNLLSSNPSLFSRIKSALRIGERRWNLILDNGILIKMPENNVLDAWSNLDKILSIRGSEIDLKVIDLRNEDKIFLEEKTK